MKRSETAPRFSVVAPAYDAVAPVYDDQLAGDRWMRSRLWEHFDRVFRPGQRVLDVGCGTGDDAIHLARSGIDVVGVDVSSGMLAVAATKVERARLAGAHGPLLAGRVHLVHADALDLIAWPAGDFDGVVASFAALNTLPDLASFAAVSAHLLRPGGHLVVHLLNRLSLWEWLGDVARRQDERVEPREPPRRGQTERVFVVGGRPVQHRLDDPAEAYERFFAHLYERRQAYALGVLRPPHTLRRCPAPIAAGLGWLERYVGGWRPFVGLGRFFVLDLVRRR